MAQQLLDKLADLRSRIRRALWMYGGCWLVAVFLMVTSAACVADWIFHFDDSGVRALLLLTVLATSGYVGWRLLIVPLLTQLGDVDLALRIERRFPGLGDSLASTVEFLAHAQDERLGSPAMQREVIRRTVERLNRVSFDGLIETRPLRQVGLLAAIVVTIVVGLSGLNPARAAIALKRLALPFADVPWPRKFELRFVTEELEPLVKSNEREITVVQGATLEVYVENTRGPLPKDLTLECVRADGRRAIERMRQTSLWDAAGKSRDIGAGSIAVTKGPIFMRARGGDGETTEIRVDVAPPPRWESLHVTVQPPAYTRLPERKLPEQVGHVEGYVGTQVVISGRGNKELASATLHRKDFDPVSLTVSADKHGVAGTFTLTKPGSSQWWLVLRDQQGFENPEVQRFDLRTLPDLVPDVRIEEPASDLTVTPDAQVRFKIASKDDLGLKQVDLTHDNAGQAIDVPQETDPSKALESKDRPQDAPAVAPLNVAGTAKAEVRITIAQPTDWPQQLVSEHTLDLAPLKLTAGMKVTVVAEATDGCDLSGPHFGRSNPRFLRVISAEEKRLELSDRQAQLLLELDRVQKLETTARSHVKELQTQLEQTGTLRPEDLDLLRRVELDQRQIGSRLGNEQDGIEAQTRSLRAEREMNGVKDPQAEKLLSDVIGEVEFLRQSSLKQIEQQLNLALKSTASQSKGTDDEAAKTAARQALQKSAQGQDQVLETLGKLLAELESWREDRNISADLRELSNDQEKLTRDTKELGQQTLSKSLAELSPQQRAELSKLAERQEQLANRVDTLKKQLATPPSEDRPESEEHQAAKESLREGLEREDIAPQMRQVGSEISRNNISQALQRAEEVQEKLRKLREDVDDNALTDQETLVKQLGEARSEIEQLQEQQETLRKKVAEAQDLPPAEREPVLKQLQKEEEQLRQKTEEVLRRLQRMQSNSARRATQRAADHMRRAEEAIAQDNGEQAQAEMKETLDDLEQAERDVNRDKQAAELQLAQEAMERIADGLQALHDRQVAAITETERIRQEFDAAGKFSRGLLKSVRTLAQTQRQLSEEAANLANDVKSVEILSLALSGASKIMSQAAEQLEKPDVSTETLRRQQRAKQRLADMLDALKDKPEDADPKKPPQPSEGEQSSGPPGESIPIIAQLKVIRALQVELIERTAQIDEQRASKGELTPEETAELQSIAELQSRLADMIRDLTQFFGDDPSEPHM